MRKFKVCFVLPKFLESEGISIIAKRLCLHLMDQNVEAHIVALESSKVSVETEIRSNKIDGIPVHFVSPATTNPLDQPFYAWGLDNLAYALGVLDQKYDFDIFHGQYIVPSGYIATLVGKKLKKPVVVTIQGNDIGNDIFNPTKFPLIRWTLENVDKITAVSSDLKEWAKLIVPKAKIEVVYNHVDLNVIPNSVTGKFDDRLNGKIVIGAFGEIKRKKGFTYLLRSFSEVLKTHQNAMLLVIGEVRKGEDAEYKKLIEELGLAGKIIVTGLLPHKDGLKALSSVDILVYPSTSEGSPNAIVEAMAEKKAIVATSVGSMPELLTHNKDSLIVNPRSAEELTYAILALLKDPKKRQALGENAYHKVIKQLNAEVEVKKWISVYKKLLKNKLN